MTAKRRSTKKKDGARSVRHGNVTYSSRPSDNTDCRIRCSPPSRQTFGDGSKQTTVRYRHRTLDIKSPPSGKRKPGVRTGPKTAKTAKTGKTAKTAKKTVSKAPKAPETPSKLSALVKELEKEVQKPKAPAKKVPAKKAPAKTTVKKAPAVKKTVSPGAMPNTEIRSWYMAKFPTDELGKQIRPKLTFAKVWAEMKKGSDYYGMMPHDSVMRERVFDGISDAYKIPYDTVYDTWLNARAVQRMKKPTAKDVILKKAAEEGMNAKELDKHLIVARPVPVEVPKAPAVKTSSKRTSAKKAAVPGSRGVQGRFNAGALKAVAQFLHKMDKTLDMPIFSADSMFIDDGHIMALRLISRMPGKSFVGLPLDPSKKNLAVPMDSLIKRLNSEVMDVYYKDGRLYYSWKDSPELAVSTAVRESDNPNIKKFAWGRNANIEGDIRFRTTQAKFASDVKKTISSVGTPTTKKTYALSMCPPKGGLSYDERIPSQCAGYDAYYLRMIADLVAKAKGSQCIVMFKPNFPLRIICDFGPYMTEIMLAPVVTPED